jgi:hypothetical protein
MREGVLLCNDKVRQDGEWQVDQAHLAVSHNVKKTNDVGASTQVLEDLDFTLDLLLLDRLEDLDDAFLVVDDVDALKNFRVLSAAWPVKVSLGSTATGQARAPILRTTS